MLPASICQWNAQYCFFLVSGLLGRDTEPSTMELAASSKHQCRNIDQERTAQWIITMSYSTALVTIKPLKCTDWQNFGNSGNGASGWEKNQFFDLKVDKQESWWTVNWMYSSVSLLCRSFCGSRTWSSFTWIYFASGATWPAYREESCPTPNASWPSPLAPLSWQWADWVYSQSLPFMHW